MRSALASFAAYPWRRQCLCLLPLACLLLWVAFFLGTGDALTRRFLLFRAGWPGLTKAMEFATDATGYALYAVYAGLFVLGVKNGDRRLVRLVLLYVFMQLCLTVLLVQGLKFLSGRPRPLPAFTGAEFSPFADNSDFRSFPSGHTADIVCSASCLAAWFTATRISLCMGLTIALVGFSRIYLSMHHLSDVVAGAVIGVLASLLIHHFSREPS